MFLIIIGLLLAAHIAGLVSVFSLADHRLDGLVPLFHFDLERNYPTYYSSFALLCCAALLWIAGAWHKNQGGLSHLHWYGLAVVFLLLSLDEMIPIHEDFSIATRRYIRASGLFGRPWLAWVIPQGIALTALLDRAWVIPYTVALAGIAVINVNFLRSLPRKTLIWFLFSGGIYVIGAVGLELVGGVEADVHGMETLVYAVISTVEELLEMLGVVLFIYALLAYITTRFQHLTFSLVEFREQKDD